MEDKQKEDLEKGASKTKREHVGRLNNFKHLYVFHHFSLDIVVRYVLINHCS